VTSGVPTFDVPRSAASAKALREMRAELGLAGEVTVHDLVGLEGVVGLSESAADPGPAAEALERALSAALDALEEMRRREGEALARALSARLAAVEQGAADIGAAAPPSVEAYRERLAARVP